MAMPGPIFCELMAEPVPPPLGTAPMITDTLRPLTGTPVASTGEGGRPPPMKAEERVPPQ